MTRPLRPLRTAQAALHASSTTQREWHGNIIRETTGHHIHEISRRTF